jgi:hypothetical protein
MTSRLSLASSRRTAADHQGAHRSSKPEVAFLGHQASELSGIEGRLAVFGTATMSSGKDSAMSVYGIPFVRCRVSPPRSAAIHETLLVVNRIQMWPPPRVLPLSEKIEVSGPNRHPLMQSSPHR